MQYFRLYMKHHFLISIFLINLLLLGGCELNNPYEDDEEDFEPQKEYTYIDLGLSVKWATCNVGANNPEEYGDYFAWGEVQPNRHYSWDYYTWGHGFYSLTKYCNDRNYGYNGFMDYKLELEKTDDAASDNWGSEWRMPTKEELQELLDNCTWTWTTLNDVYGYKVEGANGKSIFLPAAGFKSDQSIYSAGSQGYYWANSCVESFPAYAWMIHFNSKYMTLDYFPRFYGRTIRPVCP